MLKKLGKEYVVLNTSKRRIFVTCNERSQICTYRFIVQGEIKGSTNVSKPTFFSQKIFVIGSAVTAPSYSEQIT